MDQKHRAAFRQFAGQDRYRKFVRAISQDCPRKGRLFFWQEKLWSEFLVQFPQAPTVETDVLRAFCICDIHDCDLEVSPTNEPKPEVRDTPEYDHASDTLFPLASGPYMVCPQCQSERQRWISDHSELCRILRRKTTYEAYCHRLMDQIIDPESRDRMKREMEARIKERSGEILAQMQPGDELWEWDGGGWHHLAGRSGIAIVRAGKIIKKWCEVKS